MVSFFLTYLIMAREVAQAGLELAILLQHPPCPDCRCTPPHLAALLWFLIPGFLLLTFLPRMTLDDIEEAKGKGERTVVV